MAYGIFTSKKRRRLRSRWVRANSLQFNRANVYDIDSRYVDIECLQQGKDRYACNVISGRINNRDILVFDYRYDVGVMHKKTVESIQAMIVPSPTPLKPLFIRPEGLIDKASQFFGAEDLNFESAEFSRKFAVAAPDRKWAYDVIHPRMMEHLLTTTRFSIQLAENAIIAWRANGFDGDDYQAAFELLDGILERLPNYLIREQTEQ